MLHQENPFIQFRSRSTLDFPTHLHDVLELVFLHRGSCEVICANRRYALGPGELFVSFPNQPHGYENSRDVQSDVLIVPATFLTPWRNQISQLIPAHPVMSPDDWQDTDIPALLDMIRSSLIPIFLIILVTTVITFGITGTLVQRFLKEEEEEHE